jgi:dTDP-4-amino-4,6-dideoxygalactose transaminase
MIVTNDKERAERLRCLRAHGSNPKYYHKLIGGNFRLDAIQAALVQVKLKYLDAWTAARQLNAKRYEAFFANTEFRVIKSSVYSRNRASVPQKRSIAALWKRLPELVLPSVVSNRHVFNQYVIRVAERDRLKAALQARGVASEIYYPVPMHLQECFRFLGYSAGDFPESESAARETLALPIYPELKEEQCRYIVECVQNCLQNDGDSPPDRQGSDLNIEKPINQIAGNALLYNLQ